MLPKTSHSGLTPLAEGVAPQWRERAVFAGTPLSFIIQHFNDRVGAPGGICRRGSCLPLAAGGRTRSRCMLCLGAFRPARLRPCTFVPAHHRALFVSRLPAAQVTKLMVQAEGWRGVNGTHIMTGAQPSQRPVQDVWRILKEQPAQQQVGWLGLGLGLGRPLPVLVGAAVACCSARSAVPWGAAPMSRAAAAVSCVGRCAREQDGCAGQHSGLCLPPAFPCSPGGAQVEHLVTNVGLSELVFPCKTPLIHPFFTEVGWR